MSSIRSKGLIECVSNISQGKSPMVQEVQNKLVNLLDHRFSLNNLAPGHPTDALLQDVGRWGSVCLANYVLQYFSYHWKEIMIQ